MTTRPPGFDPTDWKAAPHTAWAFRNVEDFLPVRTIAASEHPSPLSVANLDWPKLVVDGAEQAWDLYFETVHATSVTVVAKGQIAAEWSLDPMSPTTRHTLFSVTKSVVGLAALLLAAEGRLDLKARAAEVAPVLAETAFAKARITDLLAMLDGVPFNENYNDAGADIHLYSRHYWGGAPGGTISGLGAIPKGEAAPGRFAYRTPVADVIGWVLRGATGLSLAELISELIWKPIGAEQDALLICDTAAAEIAGTGLSATPRDLARLALALIEEERSPFPSSVRDQLFAGGDPQVVAAAGYTTRPGWSYANLSWSPAPGQLAAMGVHGQKFMLDRASGTALIVTAAAPTADVRHLDAWHAAAFAAVRNLGS